MEDKKPTTTEALSHDVRPEHEILRKAMMQWSEEAPKGENRSAIVIQVTEKDGELSASSHINGDPNDLMQSVTACMSAVTNDNPVGNILRNAAIGALIKLGVISPATLEASTQPETETHNNESNE